MSDYVKGELEVKECYLNSDGVFWVSFTETEGHWGFTHQLATEESRGRTTFHDDGTESYEPDFHEPATALAYVLVDYDTTGKLMGIEIVGLPRTAQEWDQIHGTVARGRN